MIIRKLHIYGYGKWIDQIFNFDEQLQIFYGPNESGKSTLQSFIRSILFGFPNRRKRTHQINRYEPKQSDIYGGKLLIENTNHGDLWIERTSKHLQVTNFQGEVLPNRTLDEVLGGIDEDLFDNFYGFTLGNLQELSNVGADQLNDYFLSIGTLGSEKFLQIAKALEKETDEIFKGRGKNPPLNQLLNEYEVLEEREQRMKESMDQYQSLVESRKNVERIIQQTNIRIQEYEEEIRRMDRLMDHYQVYLKLISVQGELGQLKFTEIRENAPKQLSDAENIIDNINQEIPTIEERIHHINHDIAQMTRLNWAQNNSEERVGWTQATSKAQEIQRRINNLEEKRSELGQELKEIADNNKLDVNKVVTEEEFNERLPQLKTIQFEIEDREDELKQTSGKQEYLLQQRVSYQSQGVSLRQKIAQLENQRVNDEELLIQETRLSAYFPGLILVILGIVAYIFQSFNVLASFQYWNIVGLCLALIGMIMMTVVFIRHRSIANEFENSPILDEIIRYQEDQAFYAEQSRNLNNDISLLDNEVEAIESQIMDLEFNRNQMLETLGFLPEADLDLVLKTNPIRTFSQVMARRGAIQLELEELSQKMQEWKDEIHPLIARFPFHGEGDIELLEHVNNVEKSLVEVVNRAKILEQRLAESKRSIDNYRKRQKEQEKLIQEIFEEIGVWNKIEFDQRLATNKQIRELKEKESIYLGQVEPVLSALAEVESQQALDSEYQDLQRQLAILRSKLEPNLRERANLTVEINQLEQDGTYQELGQDIENKRSEIEELTKDYAGKKIATDLIYQTLRHGLDNPVEEMNEIANQIFTKLSNQRYTEIKINKRSIRVKHADNVLFQPHELSQGTLEQLYVALRLAFIINARTMVKMPIIIDDAFVNFDEGRRENMYEVLGDISSEIQILFFTFDQLAQQAFNSDQIINLEDIQMSPEN